ncbi:MAG: hypothetical protein EP348_01020, partial [Alphaproteobacteria bacterium]
MSKEADHKARISPDYFNQGSETASAGGGFIAKGGVVHHYEIGESVNFLRPYGKTYEEALQNLITGSIQIIGLDEVRAQYAEQWGEIRENVMVIAENYLSRKLGRHDVFVPLDDGHFALLFAGVTRAEAIRKSKEIAADLVNKLFGELPGGELISVQAAMLEIGDFEDLDRIKSLEDLVSCFQAAIIRSRAREVEEFEERRTELAVRYRPLINHRKGLVSINEVVCVHKSDDGEEVAELLEAAAETSARMRAEMDLLVLEKCGPFIEALEEGEGRPLFLIPVHFETLAHSYTRGKYARLLASLPKYTERHVLLNVQGVGTGVPNSRYRQIFTSLRALVLGFSFEVGPAWSDFEAIRDLPVRAIALAGHDRLEMSEIERLFSRAKKHHRKAIWRSVDHDTLGKAAFSLGVDYV